MREVIARRLRRAAALAAIACIGLGGCATFHPADPSALGGNVPPRAQVADVPFYPQKEKYCGPAALAMALTWSGKPISQDQAAALTFTPGRDGTFRADMVTAALRNGRLPVRLRNIEAVMKELAAGRPVIVFENRGLSLWHVWHYAVLTGYDLDKDLVIMHSGKNPDEEIGIKLFQRMWHRGENWSLVVLPPGTLPVDAEEHDVLEAANGLERVKDYAAAATAYQSITARWPRDWAAYFGLGNVRYAQADYRAAEGAYRKALAIRPDGAEIWNNLAYSIAKQGRKTEAIDAARKAVSMASDKGPFQRTLAELSDAKTSP